MDNTLKEVNIWKSIKKFWIDGLPDTQLYFGRVVTSPGSETINQWLCIQTSDLIPSQVSSAFMTAFMCSKEDPEFDYLAALRDDALSLLEEGRIDLYNTYTEPWEKIGGILLDVTFQANPIPIAGKAYMSYIETSLKWGAVWWK